MQGHIQQYSDQPRGLLDATPGWLPLIEATIPRSTDGTNRPMIVPPGGDRPVPYERMSQVAEAVDTMRWLLEWYVRTAARGLAKSPDLCAQIAVLPPDGTPEHREAKPIWRDILDRAHDRGGGNDKADYGNAVHLTEHYGTPIEAVPSEMEFDVRALRLGFEQKGIRKVRTEVFVVNDDLRAAGTFDHEAHYPMPYGEIEWVPEDLWDVPIGLAIGDVKTGKYSAWKWVIQNTGYANGATVDIATLAAGEFAERTPLQVSKHVGVIAHVPRHGGAVTFDPLDIAGAYKYAKAARMIKPGQDRKDWKGPALGLLKRKDVLLATIKAADSRSELRRIAQTQERWLTNEVRDALNRRWIEVS